MSKAFRLLHSFLVVLAVVIALSQFGVVPPHAAAYYIPGMKPVYYATGDAVKVKVNSLRSFKTLIPKSYYSLPFCRPEHIESVREAFGEVIFGETRQNSLYTLKMGVNESCIELPSCDKEENTRQVVLQLDALEKAVSQGYRAGMSIDNLPAYNSGELTEFGYGCSPEFFSSINNFPFHSGYDIGVSKECIGETLLNNFLQFEISYNRSPTDPNKYMVVGVTVIPYSVDFTQTQIACTDTFDVTDHVVFSNSLSLPRLKEGNKQVTWAYGVRWVFTPDVAWATRWDAYFRSSQAGYNKRAHVVQVVFGITIILLISAAALGLLSRSVFMDLRRYELVEAVSEAMDAPQETGWKLIYADVFRPPFHSGLLSILLGNGAQVVGMGAGVLLLSNTGLLSPARRGSLLTAVVSLTFVMAILGGFVCGTALNFFRLKEWKYVLLCGVCASGGLIFSLFFSSAILAFHSSTASFSAGLVVLLLFFWLGVNLPLTLAGAFLAFRLPPITLPVRVGPLAREIPRGDWTTNRYYLFVVPAIAPLITILLELQFVMQGLWFGQVYYVFGFMAITAILWAFMTSLVTIIHIYFLLCSENHRWWWWSFIIPGSCGVDMFMYALYFYWTQISLESFASKVLYFNYMGIIAVSYGLASGVVGVVASFFFIRLLYSKVRVN